MKYLRKIISVSIVLMLLFNIFPTVSNDNGLQLETYAAFELNAEESSYGYYESYSIVSNVFFDYDHGDVMCVYEWEEEISGSTCDHNSDNECNPDPPTVNMTPVASFCIFLDEIYPGG